MAHCAKCKNPFTGCGNPACPCHGDNRTREQDPEWERIAKENSKTELRYRLDDQAGRINRRR